MDKIGVTGNNYGYETEIFKRVKDNTTYTYLLCPDDSGYEFVNFFRSCDSILLVVDKFVDGKIREIIFVARQLGIKSVMIQMVHTPGGEQFLTEMEEDIRRLLKEFGFVDNTNINPNEKDMLPMYSGNYECNYIYATNER